MNDNFFTNPVPIETEEFTVDRLIEASQNQLKSAVASSVTFGILIAIVLFLITYTFFYKQSKKIGWYRLCGILLTIGVFISGIAFWFITSNNIVSGPFIISF